MRDEKVKRFKSFVTELYKVALPLDVYSKKGLMNIAKTANPKLTGYQINNMIRTLWKVEGVMNRSYKYFLIPEMLVFEDYIASLATTKKL